MGTCNKIYHFSFSVNQGPPPPRPWIQLSTLQQGRPTDITSNDSIDSNILLIVQEIQSISLSFSCFIVATFTVMCYNVLCDRYATRAMYGYCPQWALNWEYRKKGILDEIRHYR